VDIARVELIRRAGVRSGDGAVVVWTIGVAIPPRKSAPDNHADDDAGKLEKSVMPRVEWVVTA